MPETFVSADISGQLILLGTGTSVGVPVIGCGCAVCRSEHPRNRRLRCAAALGLPEGNLLIDTPPDLRTQLLREGIGLAHAVLFTHAHADHLFGLDDVRLFPFALGGPVPLYCEAHVEERIRQSFDYAFRTVEETHAGAAPKLAFRRITTEPFEVLGRRVVPVRMQHGPRFEVLGFRFGNVAYCTDVSAIAETEQEKLRGLDVLVLGALRRRPHPTHLHLDAAIALARRLAPRRTVLTHMSHDIEYESAGRELPPAVELGYDGMRIPLT